MVFHKTKDASTTDLEGGQDGEERAFLQRGTLGNSNGRDWLLPELPPIRPRATDGVGMATEGKAPGLIAPNALYRVASTNDALRGPGASDGGWKPAVAAVDEDDEETFFERISNSDVVERLNAAIDRVFQNYTVAVLMDVVGVLLFFFDIYTDALVVDALSKTEHRDWMIATLVFILWHYVIMAVLVTAYLKRTTTKLNVLGLEEGDSALGGAAVLGSGRRHRWLLFVPVAVPGVVFLDVTMLFTSILPIAFPRLFVNFSSFLSNYNFSRFFIEFVFESIPQTILQMYIYHQLAKGRHAGSAQQRTVALSLTVSALNCLKYGWKLYKAADDAGLTLTEYFKYLLLLKGNYECSPSAMIAVINECCAVRKAPPAPAAAAPGVGGRGDGIGGRVLSCGDVAAAAGGGGGGGTVFIMNGFHLHRNKSQYGPAQQAYILLNAFERIDGCAGVGRWVVSGCPLASINRILEKGIRAFRNLTTLEVNECALRGDTWKLVTRAIKRHKRLEKVKLIQTGVLTKYRNAKRMRVVTGLFKHSLGLRTVALCLNWWSEEYLQNAVDMYLLDHPSLESLAIELPPGAPFAPRDMGTAADPWVGADVSHHGKAPVHRSGQRNSISIRSSLGGVATAASGQCGSGGATASDQLPTAWYGVRSRLAEAANGSGRTAAGGQGGGSGAAGGATSRTRSYFGVSGPAAGFMSPFTPDATASSQVIGPGNAGNGSSGVGTAGAAMLGLVQYGGAMLSGLASYVTDGAVSTIQGLAAVAAGQPRGSTAAAGGSGGNPGVASPRYCWLLAAVLSSAPALRSLYVHNHALPVAAPEGVGQLAAALAGNTRLTALSLRGSAVGDAGAAALARVLAGQNSNLQLLNLRRCQLHDEGVSALCACLLENRGLRSLDLSHNRVQGQAPGHGAGPSGGRLAGLERALRINTSLHELRLEGWRDTFDNPQAASSLAAALAVNEGLRTLSLAGCCLDSQSAAAMASALAINTCLTSLDLSASCADGGAVGLGGAGSSGGGAAAATAAAGGGGAGSGPEGRIGDAAVAALGTALGRNRALKELFLAGCRCGELGGAALLAALRSNSVLQVLDLSGDGAGRDGAGGFGVVGDGGGGNSSPGDATGGAGGGVGSVSGLSTPTAAAVAAMTGVDDESATCLFTALQTNSGLRVLRMRGANGLTLRALRAAGEMLRRNDCLLELDLSNSTFLVVDCPSVAIAATSGAMATVGSHHPAISSTVLQSGNSQPNPQLRPPPPTATAAAASRTAAEQPSPPPALQSSISLSSLQSSGSLNRIWHSHCHEGPPAPPPRPPHHHHQQQQQQQQQPQQHSQADQPLISRHSRQNSYHSDYAPSACGSAAALRGNGGSTASLTTSWVPSVGGLTGPGSVAAAAVAATGGGGHGGSGGGGGEGGLSPEAWEVVGAMWSALAGGVAVNGRLRILRLSYCGLGTVGVTALAPALMQNTTLQELDLAGLPAVTARTQLAAVIAKAATAMATAAAAAATADPSVSSPLSLHQSPAAAIGISSASRCALTCIRATDESYEVVDLLGASKVTSRAAEEAAAAAEEAMRAPGGGGHNGKGRGGTGGASLLSAEEGGSGGSGGGLGRGKSWSWKFWRR